MAAAPARAVNPHGGDKDDIAEAGKSFGLLAQPQPVRGEIGKEGGGALEVAVLQVRSGLLGRVETADQARHGRAPGCRGRPDDPVHPRRPDVCRPAGLTRQRGAASDPRARGECERAVVEVSGGTGWSPFPRAHHATSGIIIAGTSLIE